jgi:uncharacterized RDD family membrane protein YckC
VTDDDDVVGPRVAAALVDILVIVALFFVLGLTVGEAEGEDAGFSVVLGTGATLAWIALGLLYYFATEAVWGRTLGKRLLGLRVARTDGRRAGAGAIAVRTLLRVVDVLPVLYLVGFAVLLTAGKGWQRIGDLAAGTAVVRAAASDPR